MKLEEAVKILKYYLEMEEFDSTEDFLTAIRIVLEKLENKKQKEKINKALEIAFEYGQIDGEHHKTWVIDQIVRTLTRK